MEHEMTMAEFFEMVERVVGPAAAARGWMSSGEGLFIRDEGDILLDFRVSGAFRSLERDTRNVTLRARVSITSRRLNNSNLFIAQQRPVKSAKKLVTHAMGCPLSQLSVVITVDNSSWSDAGAELVGKCTEEADRIRGKYGSVEKIKEYYENLYRSGDERTDRQVLMCIDMLLGNYEEALKLISEARPNLIVDKDYTIWGYAARYARKMLATRMSGTIQ
jgi:hypothetical protein